MGHLQRAQRGDDPAVTAGDPTRRGATGAPSPPPARPRAVVDAGRSIRQMTEPLRRWARYDRPRSRGPRRDRHQGFASVEWRPHPADSAALELVPRVLGRFAPWESRVRSAGPGTCFGGATAPPPAPAPCAPMLADARPTARAIVVDADAGHGRRHRSLRRLLTADLREPPLVRQSRPVGYRKVRRTHPATGRLISRRDCGWVRGNGSGRDGLADRLDVRCARCSEPVNEGQA